MSIIHIVDVTAEIQDYPHIPYVKHIESPIPVSKYTVELATLVHLWDQTNCLVTHSNNNGLNSFENYKELAKTFIANGEVEISNDGEYKACVNNVLSLSPENTQKLKTIYEPDEIKIEEIYKSLFSFFKAVGLNEKFIHAVEVGNEQFCLATFFFSEKLSQGQEYETKWLTELDELIGII